MNSNLVVILTKNAHNAQEILRLLDGSSYELALSSPAAPLGKEKYSRISLLLINGCDESQFTFLNELNIPEHIPALILGEKIKPPPHIASKIAQADCKRLFDYLGGKLQRDVLITRFAFLHTVSRLSFEHNSYIHYHDQVLDLFSSRDGLTGLYNRHQFNRILEEEFCDHADSELELALLFLDIDFFNEINKANGQTFGDFVLNEMAARLTNSTRVNDTCFRLSGSDFVVLMPATNLATAKRRAEKILKQCSEKSFIRNGIEQHVTLSIGLASTDSQHLASADEFIHMGETALFLAKAEGRNRVHVYTAGNNNSHSMIQHDFESIKISLNRILEKTRNAAIASLQLLARDIAGPEHREHLSRANRYADLFCKHLGLTPAITDTLQNVLILNTSIRYFLHGELLAKKEPFNNNDRTLLQDYPYKLAEIIDIFDYFSQERSLLSTRSEHFDGKGYPEGLQGSEIPLGARILNIVDSFAAMKGTRPYRRAMPSEAILLELKEQAGKQFDPFLVLHFIDIIERNNLLDLSTEEISEIRAELRHIHLESKP